MGVMFGPNCHCVGKTTSVAPATSRKPAGPLVTKTVPILEVPMDRLTGLFAALFVFVSACSGTIDHRGNSDDADNSASDESDDADPIPDEGSGPDGLARNPSFRLRCDDPSRPSPGSSPLVRLTAVEYHSTLRDLFPSVSLAKPSLPAENIVGGFSNNAAGQTASAELIEGLEKTTDALVTKLEANMSGILPCQPEDEADASCANTFVKEFGARAFRRPLEDDEKTRFVDFLLDQAKTIGFNKAAALTVGAMVQSPQFLYRIERGVSTSDDAAAKLDGYEVASRLSYLLWDTMPDDELFEAASSGELDKRSGIEKQAQRMLEDPRARASVSLFHEQWLDLERLDRLARSKSKEMFQDYSDDVAADLAASTRKFVEEAFWEGSTQTFFAGAHAFTTDSSAFIYGVDAPGSDTPVRIATDDSQRVGFMGQAGVLAGLAHDTLHAPVLRGTFILDRLLCTAVSPPPPDTSTALPKVPEGEVMTTRQRFQQIHEQGTCKACHQIIDGAGFALENFDAIGRYREEENGLPIDATASLVGTANEAPFTGAVGLGRLLAGSEQAAQCVVAHWLRYSLARTETENDGCIIRSLTDALLASDGNMTALLVGLVTSDGFRYRSPLEL